MCSKAIDDFAALFYLLLKDTELKRERINITSSHWDRSGDMNVNIMHCWLSCVSSLLVYCLKNHILYVLPCSACYLGHHGQVKVNGTRNQTRESNARQPATVEQKTWKTGWWKRKCSSATKKSTIKMHTASWHTHTQYSHACKSE